MQLTRLIIIGLLVGLQPAYAARISAKFVTAAGSDNQIQFNNSGSFGASSYFTYQHALGELWLSGLGNLTLDAILIGGSSQAGPSLLANQPGEAVLIGSGTGPNLSGGGTYDVHVGFHAGKTLTTGTGNTITGTNSDVAAASSYNSVYGFAASATGNRSVSIGSYDGGGYSASASGNSAVAVGNGAVASGNTSSAFGSPANAGGDYSAAFVGNAAGQYASAFGYGSSASGTGGLAIGGYSTSTSGAYATMIGYHITGGSYAGAVAIGADHTGTGAAPTAQDDFILGTANHHVKILGTLAAPTIKLTTGAGAGLVLTSDASGNGSWTSAGAGTVTAVTASSPLASSGSSAPNITISKSDGSTNGYLSSADWTTFNNKQAALAKADASHDGYLSSGDWSTFNSASSAQTFHNETYNLGIKAAIASNTLVVSLVQADGSTNPSTGAAAVKVGFRSTTATTGGYSEVSFTAAASITLAAADSIGAVAAVQAGLYVYLISDSTNEICLSFGQIDDSVVQSASALTGGADTDGTKLWCTGAHTSRPTRLIGRVVATWSNPNWGSITNVNITDNIPIITSWIPYTPTISAGMCGGGCNLISFFWRRVGDTLEVRGNWTNGTVSGSVASISLPTGLTMDASKLPTLAASTASMVGTWWHNNHAYEDGAILSQTSTSPNNDYTKVNFGTSTTGTGMLTPQWASSIMSGYDVLSANFAVPVVGW